MANDRERYARAFEHFKAKAQSTALLEIRDLWATIAASYRYLHEREERLESEDRHRAGTAKALEPPELLTPRSASRNP